MDATPLTVDALGQKCPMPVVMLARFIRNVPSGSIVEVLCDDPAAQHDIPAWCRMRDATYLGCTSSGGVDTHRLQLA
jgi:tRNA 2-thiouridine synthesizing protein A